MKKGFLNFLFLFIIAILVIVANSCDPGHSGTTILRNETPEKLILIYQTYRANDSTVIIEPYSSAQILAFGGLGAGENYNCCRCEFESVSLIPIDTTLNLNKSINDEDNWNMINENKRRFSSKEITCEFVVTDIDID